ncbi:NAD(P)-binding protein [Hesseltinella vesiculosa]|uniref:NAD(P)-binding protein n=1 Tax=Hesseltinella vesiculosa TaxID=101127 RepID=A0A1X2G2N4_9FUNG|nr:NAD(P)-binding protein [Hesseltinella vesiculosa]
MAALYIITGANRGFGQAIATNLGAQAKCPQQFILIGREEASLASTAAQLRQHQTTLAVELIAHPHALDNAASVDQYILPRLDQLVKSLAATSITLINNAGSTGDLSQTVGDYTSEAIQRYVDMNITSYITLVSGVVQLQTNTWKAQKLTVVNISSLLAVQAFSHWGLYATGKAARDMLLAVISKEHSASVRTLSYAPGPLDNQMQEQVRQTLGDPEQATLYKDMAQKGNLVSMDDSAKKLILLLENDTFESGAHLDFFDI